MIETCENCPKFSKCTEICKKIESQLEQRPRFSPKELVPNQEIDLSRKIDLASMYEDVEPLEISWDKSQVEPQAAEIGWDDRAYLLEAIKAATRGKGLKFQRRFRSFLMCETIKRIAKRSGSTNQNIQKQFQVVIKRTHKIISKGKRAIKSAMTPLKFKQKISLSDE